jgi:hypothetical protein
VAETVKLTMRPASKTYPPDGALLTPKKNNRRLRSDQQLPPCLATSFDDETTDSNLELERLNRDLQDLDIALPLLEDLHSSSSSSSTTSSGLSPLKGLQTPPPRTTCMYTNSGIPSSRDSTPGSTTSLTKRSGQVAPTRPSRCQLKARKRPFETPKIGYRPEVNEDDFSVQLNLRMRLRPSYIPIISSQYVHRDPKSVISQRSDTGKALTYENVSSNKSENLRSPPLILSPPRACLFSTFRIQYDDVPEALCVPDVPSKERPSSQPVLLRPKPKRLKISHHSTCEDSPSSLNDRPDLPLNLAS